jgi:hypothetical protein
MIFCDGSVATIDYEIDPWTYAAFGSRNGHETGNRAPR